MHARASGLGITPRGHHRGGSYERAGGGRSGGALARATLRGLALPGDTLRGLALSVRAPRTQAPGAPASVERTSVRWKFTWLREAVGPRWPW